MLLSIVVPIYNVERYLRKCLSSIFEQNAEINEFEVIAVVDGSPDQSIKIVEEFVDKYPNITLLTQVNQGLSVARNNGLKLAQGKYVWFVDSDDWLCNDAINSILDIVTSEDFDIVATNLKEVNEVSGKFSVEKQSVYLACKNVVAGKDYIFDKGRFAPVQRFIYSTEFLRNNNLCFYPGIFHEDGQFSLRALYFAKKVFLSNLVVYSYLLRSGSIMRSMNIKNARDLITVYKTLVDFGHKYVGKKDQRWWAATLAKLLLLVITWMPQLCDEVEYTRLLKKNRLLFKIKIWNVLLAKHVSRSDFKRVFLAVFRRRAFQKRINKYDKK